MEQLSIFEDLLIESPLLGHVSSYLTLCDMKNLIIASKKIYMSPKTIFIMRKSAHKRSSTLISKLLKRYYRIIESIKRIEYNNFYIPCNKYFHVTPFYYYRYYPKEHVIDYFRCAKDKLLYDVEVSLPSINQNDSNRTRSDLFKLICSLSIEDISYIGW